MKGFEHMKIRSAVKMVKQPIVEQLEKRIEVLERDCLKLRQEANESRHEKEKYRQIVEHAPTGIYEFDLQRLKFTRVNDIMCKVTGYSREEFLSMDPMMLLTAESKPQLIERTNKLLAGENVPEAAEYKIKTKDGREIWALSSTRLIHENGKPTLASVITTDISDHKRMEEALQKSEERYALATRAARVGVWDWDIQTKNYTHFTPKEIQVADLVKQGKTTKEIAEITNSSERAIEFHRNNIRKKLGLANKKTNLRSHLLGLQ
jgi:PAS domain S-box-containing protein